jgi:hypothetical protein
MQAVRDTLRRLAAIEPGDLPVLSVYLDVGPQMIGEKPELRSGLIVLKDRLNELVMTFWPHGPVLESIRADAALIGHYLDEAYAPGARGLALFACTGRGLFEVVEVGVPFENQVTAGPAPNLIQLARLLDEPERAVVAALDTTTSTAWLVVRRQGFLVEMGGPGDKNTMLYCTRSLGGWS